MLDLQDAGSRGFGIALCVAIRALDLRLRDMPALDKIRLTCKPYITDSAAE